LSRGIRIGLKDVYYALLEGDVVNQGAAYQVPVRLIGAITANINPNPSSETLFADDGPIEVASTLGNIELELGLADLPLPSQAILLGHGYIDGRLIKRADDIPPWLALGFKALKSNGNYRYTWLLKGKFQVPEESHETKGDAITFQTPTITGNFVARDFDKRYQIQGDEDDQLFTTVMSNLWYDEFSIDADRSTFSVTPATVTPTRNVSFNLNISDARGTLGVLMAGATAIQLVSDRGDDLTAFNSVTLTAGAGTRAMTLSTVGTHVISVILSGVLAVKSFVVNVS